MAQQTVQTISRAGQSLTDLAVAADAGLSDKWAGTGKEFLYINNGGGAPITLTLALASAATIDGQTAPNKTISITNGKAYLLGPFPINFYNDANGNVNISYSAVTTVKILVCILGN